MEIAPETRLSGIIAVVRSRTADAARTIGRGLAEAGVDFVEITMTVPGAADVIRSLAEELEVPVGVGTVTDPAEVEAAVSAGARFVVSPGFQPDVVRAGLDAAVPVVPGAMTPTEIMAAWDSGATAVKVFPISVLGGPAFLRALRAPLPHIPLVPSGGIGPDEVADYRRAGAVAVSLGSSLVDEEAAEARDIEKVAAHARQELAGPG